FFFPITKARKETTPSQILSGNCGLLDRTRPANSHRRKSGENFTQRIADLFSFAPGRQPIERMGVASKRGARRTARSRRAHGRDDRTLRRQADSIAAALGRLSAQT